MRGSRGKLAAGLAVSLLTLLATFVIVPHGLSWTLRGLAAWCGGAATYLALAWRLILRADPDATRRHSRREDESRAAIDMLLLVASLASLVAVGLALRHERAANGPVGAVGVAATIGAVALAWGLTHTIFAFHYARLFYQNDADPDGPAVGGFDFHGGGEPDYRDFAYVALSVGCTYGVTDVEVTSKSARRAVSVHGLISFAFATVILVLAVNVFTTLLSGGGQ